MNLTFKLTNASYVIRGEGNQIVLDCTTMGKSSKDGSQKLVTSTLGYYGPGQHEHAINRIIAEEVTLGPERVGLRDFLKAYRAIHNSINEQVAQLTELIKQSREK